MSGLSGKAGARHVGQSMAAPPFSRWTGATGCASDKHIPGAWKWMAEAVETAWRQRPHTVVTAGRHRAGWLITAEILPEG